MAFSWPTDIIPEIDDNRGSARNGGPVKGSVKETTPVTISTLWYFPRGEEEAVGSHSQQPKESTNDLTKKLGQKGAQ